MKKTRGFTLIELLVGIAIIAVLVGILVPVVGAARRGTYKMKNSTQLGAIMKNMVLWSDTYYHRTQDFPRRLFNPMPSTFVQGLTDPPDNMPETRIQLLLNMGSTPLSPSTLINPVGTDVPYDGANSIPIIFLTVNLAAGQKNNLSYGALQALNPEWKNQVHGSAPMLADRNINGAASHKTFWNNRNWEGDVAWGDIHVSWESGQNANSWPSTIINGKTYLHDDLVDGGGGTYPDAKISDPGVDG